MGGEGTAHWQAEKRCYRLPPFLGGELLHTHLWFCCCHTIFYANAHKRNKSEVIASHLDESTRQQQNAHPLPKHGVVEEKKKIVKIGGKKI